MYIKYLKDQLPSLITFVTLADTTNRICKDDNSEIFSVLGTALSLKVLCKAEYRKGIFITSLII
jgi:hypothetical protein